MRGSAEPKILVRKPERGVECDTTPSTRGNDMPRFCFAALITALMVARAYAQIASAPSLVGTVTDSTGRTVRLPRVSAQNQGSGDAYSAITNDQGYYSIQFIHVGRYNLNVERSGFQRFEKTGIVVDANQVVRNDV